MKENRLQIFQDYLSQFNIDPTLVRMFNDYDLVIFGEILEHIDNPDELLASCVFKKVKYILTSSYPYRNDPDYFNKSGHSQIAGEKQVVCQNILEQNYNQYAPEGGLKIWEIKK